MNKLPAVALLLALTSCPRPAPPTEKPPDPPPLDELLPAGRARCGLVTRAGETIGGPGAYLEPGKGWRCYNSKVRFGGGTGDGAVGLALWGGSLLDADLVRDDEGVDGHDQLREVFPAPGFLGVNVQSVEILQNGDDGGDAIVRVRGVSAPLTVLPQVVLVQHPYDGEVVTDFIVHPDAAYLEMTTTVYNNEALAIDVTLGDFVAMGKGLRAFTPETGFDDAGLFQSVSIFAGTSNKVSYAYTVREGKFTIPFVDAGGTGTLVKSDILISDQESYTRFLTVGSGSLASALAVAYEIRGESLGGLRVTLTRNGQPVPGVVTLYQAPAGTGAKPANQLLLDDTGVASERVRTGSYVLKAQGPGTPVKQHPDVVVVGEGSTLEVTVALDEEAHVSFHAHELAAGGADLGPIPAKLSVVPVAASPVDEHMQVKPEHGLALYRVAADGHLVASLPPGEYRFIVSRGPEYTTFTHEASLVSGQRLDVDAPLRRVVPTPGLLAAEFHQHTLGSLDSSTDLPTKVIENAAEGVELAACTDHDNVKDYGPYVQQLGLTPFFVGWAGNEISYNGVGHFNAYPLSVDGTNPFVDTGARLWAGHSVAELFASLRARSEDPVIHVSHPRATSGKGYFAQLRLNPITGEALGQTGAILTMVPEGTLTTFADDFDALEVNSEIVEPEMLEPGGEAALAALAEEWPARVPTMVDWFHLLATGRHVAALGNSDSHDFNTLSGWPRNYIVVGDDRPEAVTKDEVRAAIRAQKVLVSNGIVVTPRMGGVVHLGHDDAVPVSGPAHIELTVESAEWLGGANELLIYVDGRPLHASIASGVITPDTAAPARIPVVATCADGLCRAVATLSLVVTNDGWVVFVARGSGSARPVGGGSVWGYTNPVYLDVD